MKGVAFIGDRRLELQDFPDPAPGPCEVVLEIKASGMCGSDLTIAISARGRSVFDQQTSGKGVFLM